MSKHTASDYFTQVLRCTTSIETRVDFNEVSLSVNDKDIKYGNIRQENKVELVTNI